MNEAGYIVVEFSSGRRVALHGKEARFIHGTTALLPTLDKLANDEIRVIVNVENVAMIRRPEEHEIEWCKSFHF